MGLRLRLRTICASRLTALTLWQMHRCLSIAIPNHRIRLADRPFVATQKTPPFNDPAARDASDRIHSQTRLGLSQSLTVRCYHASAIQRDYIRPAGWQDRVSHVPSHISCWLDETGAPVGVQQKLMRHAHVSTTMDQYGNASALTKRKANRPIVQRLLQRPANQEVSIQ